MNFEKLKALLPSPWTPGGRPEAHRRSVSAAALGNSRRWHVAALGRRHGVAETPATGVHAGVFVHTPLGLFKEDGTMVSAPEYPRRTCKVPFP